MACKKTAQLRIYNDENGVMNRSLLDIGGNALVVSQFTLHASVKREIDRLIFGRRVPNMHDPFMRLLRTYVANIGSKGSNRCVWGRYADRAAQ